MSLTKPRAGSPLGAAHKRHPDRKTHLAQVAQIWEQLSEVAVDENAQLVEPFLHFPTGTHNEDIWHWLERDYPGINIAEDFLSSGRDSEPDDGPSP